MPDRVPRWGVEFGETVVRWSVGWRPYLMVVAAVAAATAVRAAIQPIVGDRLFFTTYFPAIGVAAALSGVRAGVLATALSALLAWFLFLPPAFELRLQKMEMVQITFFVVATTPLLVVALLLNRTVHWLVSQRESLIRARENEARQHSLLVRELEHRIRNLFGLVQRIGERTFQADIPHEQARALYRSRVNALAVASSAQLGNHPTVGKLLDQQLAPYAAQVTVRHCPEIDLAPLPAQQLALIFHELATNAAKYGALSRQSGHVTAVCSIERQNGEDVFAFVWEEAGGPPLHGPGRPGFGSEILDASARYAGADIAMDYAPTGLRYRYAIRLARLKD